MTTRRSLLLAGLASLTTAAVGTRMTAHADPALKQVKVVIPQNSVFILNYLGGKDAGVFSKHGIDLDVDPRPFAGYLAGLPSKQCMAVNYSGIDAIQKINEGLDWVIIGGGLTVVQNVIVRKDSPFKTPADLLGKKFGTFSTGAGSFKAARAAMIDAYNFDIVKDTQLQQVAGPALTKLLERGDVDAMINISSLNLSAEAQTDKFRVLFSANDYWRQKTGYPIVWAAPIVAWRSWVDEDQARAKDFRHGGRGILPLAEAAGKSGGRGKESRRTRGGNKTRGYCRVQEMAWRQEDVHDPLGPQSRRCPMEVPGRGATNRHNRQNTRRG